MAANISVYGGVSSQDIAVLRGRGVRSPWATYHYPTGRSLYVRSTGPIDGDPKEIINGGDFYTSVAAAADHVRAGSNDQIICLPYHTETVSTADFWPNLKAGTNIVCWGQGTSRPTFTYSATGATILFNVADVHISNAIFNLAGDPTSTTALTVTAPITISAAGCGFHGCDFQVGVDNNQLVTKAITTTDAADRLEFTDCQFYGATAAECTTVLEILGSDHLRMINTHVQAATSAVAVGVMRLNATALLGGYISGCTFINRKALSEQAVTGVAGSAGICEDTNFGILSTSGLVGWDTKGDWHFYRCKTTNTTGEAGGEEATVST